MNQPAPWSDPHPTRRRAARGVVPALASMVLVLCASVPATAQPTPGPDQLRAAAYLAANCANCHGTAGQSTSALPGLAGMPREAFIQAMNDYREGKRKPTIMHQLAKGYSDEQIVLLAEFFVRQKAK